MSTTTTTTRFPLILVLYGSQKGQAQAIAEEIIETGRQEFSLEADIHCLSQPDIIVSFILTVVSLNSNYSNT